MASFTRLTTVLLLLAAAAAADAAAPRKLALVEQQPLILKYHNGVLLKGNYTLHLLWYGSFSSSQRAVIADFIRSLSPPASSPLPLPPSAASWWRTTSRYSGGSVRISLGRQLLDDKYSLGKTLTDSHLQLLAGGTPHRDAITAVLTSDDVAVDGFCGRCGTHGSGFKKKARYPYPYLWVGNSAAQCPGQCAWPFHQPIYGPQSPPLVPPNGDVGVDGMVINLATLLAGTVTNPFGNGYFQGPKEAPMEAVTACTGMFGKGAYPGYPGQVLVDQASGASYNARGVYGRKYLLPAMWDPATSQCATLV